MTEVKLVVIWYLIGLLLVLLDLIIKNYICKRVIELKVSDILSRLLISILGPLLTFGPLCKLIFNGMAWLDQNQDKIVWRNRRANNKQILFGKVDDEE